MLDSIIRRAIEESVSAADLEEVVSARVAACIDFEDIVDDYLAAIGFQELVEEILSEHVLDILEQMC